MGRGLNRAWSWLESISVWWRKGAAWIGKWADVFGLFFGAATALLALLHSSDSPSAKSWSDGHVLPFLQIAAVPTTRSSV